MKKYILSVSILFSSVSAVANSPFDSFLTVNTKGSNIEVVIVGFNEEANTVRVGRNGEFYTISCDKLNMSSEMWGEVWRLNRQNDFDGKFAKGMRIVKKSTNKVAEEAIMEDIILSDLEKTTYATK